MFALSSALSYGAPQKTSDAAIGWQELIQMSMALLVVLALLMLLAWLYRRWQGAAGLSNGAIQILAVRSLSPRERLVLVAIGEEQLLIGVGPAGIRHLHTLAKPVETSKPQGSFAQVLSAVKIEKKKTGQSDSASEGNSDD